jgi:hypothetical protein
VLTYQGMGVLFAVQAAVAAVKQLLPWQML